MIIDDIKPQIEQNMEINAEQIVTALKLWYSRIADRAGKIISAEISNEPTKFIARTITKAIIKAIKRL